MRPKLIYIAGPYTPTEESTVEQNIAAARKVAEQVASPKIFPIVPHNTGTAIEHIGDYQFWINGTIELMHRCDAVLAMPTWERSRGATAEVRDADRVHLPVFYNIPDLIGWVSGYTRPKHGQIASLPDLLAGLPQSISLRNGDRTLEVRDWRREADDGILYRCHWPERSARIRLTSEFSTFEEVEIAEHIVLPARAEKIEFTIGFAEPPNPRLAFTIGMTKSYDEALVSEPHSAIKKGVYMDYPGGWVWQTEAAARSFIQNDLPRLVTNALAYSVYEIELPTGWKEDVTAQPATDDGVHNLINDARIIRKVGS